MGPVDFIFHAFGFAAPALAVALLVALASRWLGRSRPARWWTPVAVNALAGLLVLGAGLAYYGRDGKMATYAALVLVIGTSQWLMDRGWAR